MLYILSKPFQLTSQVGYWYNAYTNTHQIHTHCDRISKALAASMQDGVLHLNFVLAEHLLLHCELGVHNTLIIRYQPSYAQLYLEPTWTCCSTEDL